MPGATSRRRLHCEVSRNGDKEVGPWTADDVYTDGIRGNSRTSWIDKSF